MPRKAFSYGAITTLLFMQDNLDHLARDWIEEKYVLSLLASFGVMVSLGTVFLDTVLDSKWSKVQYCSTMPPYMLRSHHIHQQDYVTSTVTTHTVRLGDGLCNTLGTPHSSGALRSS